MNDLNRFIDAANKSVFVTLRGVFPGRGSLPTKQRRSVLNEFSSGEVGGVFHDKRTGRFMKIAKTTEQE